MVFRPKIVHIIHSVYARRHPSGCIDLSGTPCGSASPTPSPAAARRCGHAQRRTLARCTVRVSRFDGELVRGRSGKARNGKRRAGRGANRASIFEYGVAADTTVGGWSYRSPTHGCAGTGRSGRRQSSGSAGRRRTAATASTAADRLPKSRNIRRLPPHFGRVRLDTFVFDAVIHHQCVNRIGRVGCPIGNTLG